MNRRDFFRTLGTGLAGFAILPPATTYERIWKAVRQPLVKRDVILQMIVFDEDSRRLELIGHTTAPFGTVVRLQDCSVPSLNGEWMSEGDGKLVRWETAGFV